MSLEERESTFEYKLLVYNEQINSCLSQQHCTYKDELARSKLQSEIYNNIADTLARRNRKHLGDSSNVSDYENAVDYYKAALKICQGKKQKSEICRKIARICQQLGDEASLLAINWEMINYLEDKDKAKACMKLARNVKHNDSFAAEILEKALQYVFDEDDTPKRKRKDALKICSELKYLYWEIENESAYERIKNMEQSLKASSESG